VAARVEGVERDHLVGRREGAVGRVLVAGLPVVDVVALLAFLLVADLRRVLGLRLLRARDRRQRVVVDVDQLERVLRDVRRLRDHTRDLLALEAHLVGREDGLRVARQRRHPREVVLGEQLAGHDRDHALERLRPRRVYPVDPGVRERAAEDLHVEHPGQGDVVEIRALPADEPSVLLAPDRVPDAADFVCRRHGYRPSFISSPARRTALTMVW
jgi:hypothetical protein